MSNILLAVNGTLMRGLSLNQSLIDAGAVFVRETKTAANYHLWSIQDQYPAMVQDEELGIKLDVEIWSLTPTALVEILQKEPPGLCVGKVQLADGSTVFGMVAEPFIIKGQTEITIWGGWRQYVTSRK